MLKIKYVRTKLTQRTFYEKGENPAKEGLNWIYSS